MVIEQLLNVADYDDYVRHLPPEAPLPELMNGRFVVVARPTRRHMHYAQQLFLAIDAYLRAHQRAGEILTEFEIVLDEHTVLVPDLAYIEANSPRGRMTEERLYGAPDLVCEILSPSTRVYDVQDKYLAYLRAGVREYWLVDPDGPAGERFILFARIEEGTASTKPAYRRIAGGPAAARILPGIALDTALL
jgi:Uma2 family endonuclease